MKLKFALLPLCLFVMLHAFGFEGTVKQTVHNYNGSGNEVVMTWSISAHGCRIDMATHSKDKNGSAVLLFDAAAKTIKTYDPSAPGPKVYLQIPAADISGPGEVAVTKTTETKKIQGYNCEKWTVVLNGASYDVWITREIDFDAVAYKDLIKASVEVQALAQQGVKGFPMLTESHTDANAASVEKVTAQKLSEDVFKTPAGYTRFVADEDKTPVRTSK